LNIKVKGKCLRGKLRSRWGEHVRGDVARKARKMWEGMEEVQQLE
jgi:hypothetical protein